MKKNKRDSAAQVANFMYVAAHVLIATCTIIFVIVAVFLVDACFAGRCKPFVKSLEEWQNLISALVAVFAAAFTVRQMQLTDHRNTANAEAAMALTIRSDFLKVSRLSNFVQKNLASKANDFEAFRGVNRLEPHELYKKLLRAQVSFPEDIRSLKKALGSSVFTDAEPLFNGYTQQLLQDIRVSVQVLQPMGATLLAISQGENTDDLEALFNYDFGEIVDEMINSLNVLPRELSDFIGEIQRLEKTYRRVADKSNLLREL